MSDSVSASRDEDRPEAVHPIRIEVKGPDGHGRYVVALTGPDGACVLSDRVDLLSEDKRRSIVERAAARVPGLDECALDQRLVAEAWRLQSEREAQAAKSNGPEAGGVEACPVVEAWDEPVDGVALLDEIQEFVTDYVVVRSPAETIIPLWIMGTYVFGAFDVFPRLAVVSPEKQCGKTTLRKALAALCHRPVSASNVTAAAVFRLIERDRPTLLIDEADTFLRENEELRGVLNAGHESDGAVMRCVGDDHEPRAFNVFCPLAIFQIGRLPDTLEDRSLRADMQRRTKAEKIQPFRKRPVELRAEPLVRKLTRWALDNGEALEGLEPDMPEELANRAADNWLPILAVAELVGGAWRDRAPEAALAACGATDDESDTIGELLLTDIRDAFEHSMADRMPTAGVLEHLNGLEERPWREWRRGKEMTPRQLAGRLRPFGISPDDMRFPGGGHGRGYERAWFEDTWARYLPSSATARHPFTDNDLGQVDIRDNGQSVAETDWPTEPEIVELSPMSRRRGSETPSGDIKSRREQLLAKVEELGWPELVLDTGFHARAGEDRWREFVSGASEKRLEQAETAAGMFAA